MDMISHAVSLDGSEGSSRKQKAGTSGVRRQVSVSCILDPDSKTLNHGTGASRMAGRASSGALRASTRKPERASGLRVQGKAKISPKARSLRVQEGRDGASPDAAAQERFQTSFRPLFSALFKQPIRCY